MILVSDILTDAYRKLGRPSQDDLPYSDLISITKDVFREYQLDLKLSARDHTNTVGGWVTPSGKEMSASAFSAGDDIIPVRMEWRGVNWDTAMPPKKAEIVAYDNINELSRMGTGIYVAFYNGFQNIIFSEPDAVLAEYEFRLIYEDMSDVTASAVTDQFQMPVLFTSFCSDEVAMRALDYVENPSDTWMEKRERLRGVLTATYVQNKARFDKWRTTAFGNKKIKKVGYVPPYRRY